MKYVINYDFPPNLEQYCHRVGRTGRRENEVGYSYSLLTRNMAPLVEDLISLLTRCNQPIEPNLETLLDDYKNGLVDLGDEEEINDINAV
jgi:superfamily II DNA/RNA helicase